MGWVKELGDLFSKFQFTETVYEYQQGLMYYKGTVIEKRIKYGKKERKEYNLMEDAAFFTVYDRNRRWFDILPFMHIRRINEVPDNYYMSKFTGKPVHEDRKKKDKILRPGFYAYVPVFYEVETDTIQDRALNLKNISVCCNNVRSIIISETDKNVPIPENLEKKIFVSCNIIYYILDFYRANNKVTDYESALRTHGLSVLARKSRDMSYYDWTNKEKIEILEKVVLNDLRKKVTDKWGLKIPELTITEGIPHELYRLIHEGDQGGSFPPTLPESKA